MILRPTRRDLATVAAPLGWTLTATGTAMLLPAAVAAATGEHRALSALGVGAGLGVLAGRALSAAGRGRHALTWMLAMVTCALGWLLTATLAAVPLALSGHWAGFGDAWLEAMSGLTTTGLTLAQDLDHLPVAVNLWRHLLQLAGAVAFLVVSLSLFAAATTARGPLAVAGSRQQRILPSLGQVVHQIRAVVSPLLVAGLAALAVAVWSAGVAPLRALWHAVGLVLSAATTGGFAPTSASAGFYHSPVVEAVLIALMLGAATSVGLHVTFRRRTLRGGAGTELVGSLETRVLGLTLAGAVGVVAVGLARAGTMDGIWPLLRQGLFTTVSAHTTSGLTVTAPQLLAGDWGLLAPAGLVAAMAVGGMAASAAGGIRAFRVGVTLKGLAHDVRSVLLPESAMVVASYHDRRRRVLDDAQIRSAATMLLLYLAVYIAGGLTILAATGGIDFTAAMFEATAATSTTGLSVGVLGPGSPGVVKATVFVLMWAGRLEFIAVFALLGFAVSLVRR